LLLVTNDTQLANRLTDPANAIPRLYIVSVRGKLEKDLPGVTIRKRSKRETHVIVELHQGRHRQSRKRFGALGHEATRRKRDRFGRLELGELRPGEWRELTRADVERAFPRTSDKGQQ